MRFPTLDDLWARYGRRLERFAERALEGDRDAVRVACYRVVVEAARDLAGGTSESADADLWPWLERVAARVCGEIEVHGFERDEVPSAPLPDALPGPLRLFFELRAAREEREASRDASDAASPLTVEMLAERRRWLPALLLLPRQVRRAVEEAARAGREWWRRAAAAAPRPSPAVSQLQDLLVAGPAVSQAAAMATTVLALSVAGLGPLAIPGEAGVAVAAPAAVVERTASEATGPAAGGEPAPPSAEVPIPEPAPSSVVDSEPAPVAAEPPGPAGIEPSAPVRPKVRIEAEGGPDEPVREEPHEDSTEFVTPEAPTTADLDGDGEEDVWVGQPVVVIDCPPPEERGVTMGAVCPVMESASGGGG